MFPCQIKYSKAVPMIKMGRRDYRMKKYEIKRWCNTKKCIFCFYAGFNIDNLFQGHIRISSSSAMVVFQRFTNSHHGWPDITHFYCGLAVSLTPHLEQFCPGLEQAKSQALNQIY